MKKTNQELQNEVATLTEKLNEKIRQDMSVRSKLSELLNSYSYEQEYGYSKTKKVVDIQDWVGIAFLIGELKSDADYSCLLQSKEMFRQENDELRKRIKDLEFPPKDVIK